MAVFFITVTIICLVTGVWIAVSDILEKNTEYWERVGDDIDKLKNTPPQLWGALGFVVPPSSVLVRTDTTKKRGGTAFPSESRREISVSPQEMQIFADAILSGVKTLAEADWKDTQLGQAKVRQIKHDMLREPKLIQQRNPRNKLDGYELNKEGEDFLLQYASEWTREGFVSEFAETGPLLAN